MKKKLRDSDKSEVIEMALSDHVSFNSIYKLYGLREKDVKELMRDSLKKTSYETWRKRVRKFSDRREHYK
ncbi:MAG: TIGR03643 family protein [Alphaproteobacteria bacterium TMED87]|nr:TIGR03643 family protein [Rhodospirillaceae bacterium]OUV06842.1 MAG: TIGR03643 family protein [Alphaproteobacteria bacterium TMED87]|tara:strand:- start:760 stop:969 length:210 start_codon:yes stop_codon:yes gene_type:complete